MKTLPIIDISPFLSPSNSTINERLECSKKVHQACLEFGFFYLTGLNSILTKEELNESIDIARKFFERPLEEKKALGIKAGDGARGYQQIGENVTESKADFHEALDLYCPAPIEDSNTLLMGSNQWPLEPKSFKPIIELWIEKMKVIGMALLEATAMGLGLNMKGEEWNQLKASVEESFWVLRAIGYPKLPLEAEGHSCGAHCDYGLWTLLHSDKTEGALQVFLKDEKGLEEERGSKGNWILASPIENALVVNIGDMWEVLTNSLYKATLHRVIHTGNNYRVSLPFFYEPALDALIAPIPSIVQSQLKSNSPYAKSPKASIVYGDHLRSKVSGNFTAPVLVG